MTQQEMEAIWAEHIRHEFVTRDVEATLATMVEDASVNHVPVTTGGKGKTATDVFRDNFLGCFITDPAALHVRDRIGIDTIAWECDYPHSDSTWPQSPERVMKQMQAAHVSDEEINKISHGNAMRLYKYDPISELGRENCTVGALRAQAEGWDVSIKPRGIKASATGAADLAKFAKADD
jgi:hypothetical protein